MGGRICEISEEVHNWSVVSRCKELDGATYWRREDAGEVGSPKDGLPYLEGEEEGEVG